MEGGKAFHVGSREPERISLLPLAFG
jgi:hypothetical protein